MNARKYRHLKISGISALVQLSKNTVYLCFLVHRWNLHCHWHHVGLQLDFMSHLLRIACAFPFQREPPILPLPLLSRISEVESLLAPLGKPADWKRSSAVKGLSFLFLRHVAFIVLINKEGSSGHFFRTYLKTVPWISLALCFSGSLSFCVPSVHAIMSLQVSVGLQ